jgi:hypothetical protein
MVDIQAHKFNSLQPDTGIPGASYDVYSVGGTAPGAASLADASMLSAAPPHVAGDAFYGRGVTGRNGNLVLAVPAGFAWCLKEAKAPPAYRFDPGLHCTAVLTTTSLLLPTHLALSELPKHLPGAPPAPQLPFTGLALEPVLTAGAALGASGGLLLRVSRRRRGARRSRPWASP